MHEDAGHLRIGCRAPNESGMGFGPHVRIDVGSTGDDGNGTQLVVYYNSHYKVDDDLNVEFIQKRYKMPFASAPTQFLNDRERFRLLDVNGDSMPDLLRYEGDFLCLYFNRGDGYFYESRPNSFLFAADAISSEDTAACGQGKKVALKGLGTKENINQLWQLDVNGDGFIDLSLISNSGETSKLRVWPGLGDGSFMESPQTIVMDTQVNIPKFNLSESRIADLDGDGQFEIIALQGSSDSPVTVIDFNMSQDQGIERHLAKSNLLTTIEFESGQRYDLKYATSIDEMIRDREQPWKLHFPVVVVKQLARSEGIDGNVSVEEFLYFQPSYDAIDKSFIGFATVDAINYGDEYQKEAVDGREYSQQSSLVIENYYPWTDGVDRLKSGKLESRYIYEFTPDSKYQTESEESANLRLDDKFMHSGSSYARSQSKPTPGLLIEKQEFDWQGFFVS